MKTSTPRRLGPSCARWALSGGGRRVRSVVGHRGDGCGADDRIPDPSPIAAPASDRGRAAQSGSSAAGAARDLRPARRGLRTAEVVACARFVRNDGRRVAHPAHDLAKRRAGDCRLAARRRALAAGAGAPRRRGPRSAGTAGRDLSAEGGAPSIPGAVVRRGRRRRVPGPALDRGPSCGAPRSGGGSAPRPPTTSSSTPFRDRCSSWTHTPAASSRGTAGRRRMNRTDSSRQRWRTRWVEMRRHSASSTRCSSSTASGIAVPRPDAPGVRWRHGAGPGCRRPEPTTMLVSRGDRTDRDEGRSRHAALEPSRLRRRPLAAPVGRVRHGAMETHSKTLAAVSSPSRSMSVRRLAARPGDGGRGWD